MIHLKLPRRMKDLLALNKVSILRSYFAQILQIESVQRTFTKRVPGCQHLPYHERLATLKLQSLEHRRLIADLVMCYNIVRNLNCLNTTDFFNINTNNSLRGHSFKLVVPIAKTNIRKFFFACRIVPVWNSLPNDLVTVHTFLKAMLGVLTFPNCYPYRQHRDVSRAFQLIRCLFLDPGLLHRSKFETLVSQ